MFGMVVYIDPSKVRVSAEATLKVTLQTCVDVGGGGGGATPSSVHGWGARTPIDVHRTFP